MTVVFALVDNKYAGMIALADIVQETAIAAIKLKEMNVKELL